MRLLHSVLMQERISYHDRHGVCIGMSCVARCSNFEYYVIVFVKHLTDALRISMLEFERGDSS